MSLVGNPEDAEVFAHIWAERCESPLHNHPIPPPCKACCYVCNTQCGCECGCSAAVGVTAHTERDQ